MPVSPLDALLIPDKLLVSALSSGACSAPDCLIISNEGAVFFNIDVSTGLAVSRKSFTRFSLIKDDEAAGGEGAAAADEDAAWDGTLGSRRCAAGFFGGC